MKMGNSFQKFLSGKMFPSSPSKFETSKTLLFLWQSICLSLLKGDCVLSLDWSKCDLQFCISEKAYMSFSSLLFFSNIELFNIETHTWTHPTVIAPLNHRTWFYEAFALAPVSQMLFNLALFPSVFLFHLTKTLHWRVDPSLKGSCTFDKIGQNVIPGCNSIATLSSAQTKLPLLQIQLCWKGNTTLLEGKYNMEIQLESFRKC